MDLGTRILELQKRTVEHREVLLTEEAAKTALVMPFLQSLGYDVFNPSEVVPEFTADVGTKKGEKVDYAICDGGKVTILIECKPSTAELNINHAAQLFRYFSVTDARLAVLTNGVNYQFYSDVEKPNKMDEKPFFTFSMDAIKPTDIKTLEKFAKAGCDIGKIVQEAGNLKIQSLLRKEIEKEFAEPSEEFVRMMAARVHDGRLTPAVKESFGRMLGATISLIIRDLVTDRLSNALNASAPPPSDDAGLGGMTDAAGESVVTTQEEISGFHIVQAIASKLIDPKRVGIRDAKSYCAILLDDNNRKTIARMHFNGLTTKYFGTFVGKDEQRHLIAELTQIYQFAPLLEARLRELDEKIPV
ncbi:type I restriction endonuclease [Sphingomonas qomolangmaensis]|uniref:Type I restriction enzyme HsdR N-terminal domain-containing protein n=1 Tax=Sphingomonas qomolangmaensis TaxID=2918765 RepID=A0ABY5L3V7_9SPHN|nr:type I restriction endonuclease [Sphingomonas qomolangmaensis]UUL81643.1 type I restriction enzyme HsdR N-terminal domain-containing protein [Sphingomonas qomolangmaensis]